MSHQPVMLSKIPLHPAKVEELVRMLIKNPAPEPVINEMIKMNISEEDARKHLEYMQNTLVPHYSTQGQNTVKKGGIFLASGILLTVVGFAITFGSYNAVSSTGGTYVITYGAIITGIALAIAGLVQIIRRR